MTRTCVTLTCVAALILAASASAVKHATFKENLPLARALLHQVNTQEPAYAIHEINCRTLSPLPAISVGVIPTECLAIATNNGSGLFCGVLYVDATGPQPALPFTIDHDTAYPCSLVQRVLNKLKARGLTVSALTA